MSVDDLPTPPEANPRRARRRSWRFYFVIVLLVAVVGAGAGYTVLVQFVGYCSEDLLQLEADVASQPYVQNVTTTAATVMWRTANQVDGIVLYGTDGDLERVVEGEPTEVHAVRLRDLAPNTAYAYQVRSGDTVHEPRSFRTAPGPDGEVTAIVVGDTGSGDMPQERIADVMEGMNADLLLHTGDVVYPRGGACHYEERYYEPYEELIASVPVFPVLGNHDLRTDNGEPYLTAFDLPEDSSGTGRYYSFDYGPLHVAALDSELYYDDDSIPAAEQKSWLREDLRSTNRPWKIVVIHPALQLVALSRRRPARPGRPCRRLRGGRRRRRLRRSRAYLRATQADRWRYLLRDGRRRRRPAQRGDQRADGGSRAAPPRTQGRGDARAHGG